MPLLSQKVFGYTGGKLPAVELCAGGGSVSAELLIFQCLCTLALPTSIFEPGNIGHTSA